MRRLRLQNSMIGLQKKSKSFQTQMCCIFSGMLQSRQKRALIFHLQIMDYWLHSGQNDHFLTHKKSTKMAPKKLETFFQSLFWAQIKRRKKSRFSNATKMANMSHCAGLLRIIKYALLFECVRTTWTYQVLMYSNGRRKNWFLVSLKICQNTMKLVSFSFSIF